MNHFDEFLNDDELSKAFDSDPPEPSDEHVEQLRRQIGKQTNPSQPTRNSNERARSRHDTLLRRWHFPVSLTSLATVLLIALFVTRPFARNAEASLHDSLRATREALWIQGSTTIKFGDKTTDAESWCSPVERIVAFRSPQMLHLVDYKKGQQFSYSENQGEVFQWNADPNAEGFGRQFVHALLNDQELKSSFPYHDVSEVKKTVVDIGGSPTTRYFYRVEKRDKPENWWETSIQTDPETGRIVHWEEHHSNGMHVKVFFEYPANGPRDIFDLGAPREAEVVKIATPGSDLFGK